MATFTKAERLTGKTSIDRLIEKGKSFNSFPFRIVWLEVPENTVPAQIVISVPKRIYKRAVDRNRLKRLIREGYRKNKFMLGEHLSEKKIHLLLVYTSKTIMEYNEMEEKIISALQLLIKKTNPIKSEINNHTD